MADWKSGNRKVGATKQHRLDTAYGSPLRGDDREEV
jgi:hypothetical protein